MHPMIDLQHLEIANRKKGTRLPDREKGREGKGVQTYGVVWQSQTRKSTYFNLNEQRRLGRGGRREWELEVLEISRPRLAGWAGPPNLLIHQTSQARTCKNQRGWASFPTSRTGRMILAAPVDKNVTNFSKKPDDRYLAKLDFILQVYCGPHES